MATNRPDTDTHGGTLGPALLRPGRLDRKVRKHPAPVFDRRKGGVLIGFAAFAFRVQVQYDLPDLNGRSQILRIHSKRINCDRGIRFELLGRLCPNTTGAELRSVCTEAGMFAIRARRKSVSEKDFLDSVEKVIKGYKKFSSTPKYMVYN